MNAPMFAVVLLGLGFGLLAASSEGPVGITSLTNPGVRFAEPAEHHVRMQRGPVTIVVVDNAAMPPHHRAGYNGIASLTHEDRKENLFVPSYAGLNLEHIHDGTAVSRERLFEPRGAPMRLRRIDEHTVELHQPPTPTWALESCTRFHLLEDGAVEMTFECIPRKPVFSQGYIGLFWASYIDRPESKAIHFIGRPKGLDATADAKATWIEAITPKHGVLSTHVSSLDRREFKPGPDFPRDMLIFSYSDYVYTEPYYYGVSHGMAYALIFRRDDQIRFSQSPSGGGEGNPAWDFQCFIPNYHVGKAYGLVMRMACVPFKDRKLIGDLCRRHAMELGRRQE
jgi:hypothetical protein